MRNCLLAAAARRVKSQMGPNVVRATANRPRGGRAPAARRGDPTVSAVLDGPRRAQWLIERRERLIAQLPRRFHHARSLTRDVQELIVDEAIEFASVGHAHQLADAEELRAVFWSACEVRVRRAREGRYDTVRAGWRRAEVAALERLQAPADDDPLVATLAREERQMLAEVLRALSPRERAVVAVKHMGPGGEPLGYKKIARHLALSVGEVRAAERSIRIKFERVASATRAHEAALERKLGQLLPVPPAAEQVRGRVGAWRDVLVDWLGRPFGADASSGATQLVASGAGRGAGGALAVKLATLCIGARGAGGAAGPAPRGVPPRPARAPAPPPPAPPAPPAAEAPPPAGPPGRARRRRQGAPGGEGPATGGTAGAPADTGARRCDAKPARTATCPSASPPRKRRRSGRQRPARAGPHARLARSGQRRERRL